MYFKVKKFKNNNPVGYTLFATKVGFSVCKASELKYRGRKTVVLSGVVLNYCSINN